MPSQCAPKMPRVKPGKLLHGWVGPVALMLYTTGFGPPLEAQGEKAAPALRFIVETVLPWSFDLTVPVPGVARDSTGRLLVLGGPFQSLLVLDQRGRILRGPQVPNASPGPSAMLTVLPGDSLWASTGASTILRFAPGPTFRQVSSHMGRFQLVGDALALPDGRLLVNAIVPSPEAVGIPLHIVEADGTVSLSFAEDTAVGRVNDAQSLRRVFNLVGDRVVVLGVDGRATFYSTKGAPLKSSNLAEGVLGHVGQDSRVVGIAGCASPSYVRVIAIASSSRAARSRGGVKGYLVDYDVDGQLVRSSAALPTLPLRFLGPSRLIVYERTLSRWRLAVWRVQGGACSS